MFIGVTRLTIDNIETKMAIRVSDIKMMEERDSGFTRIYLNNDIYNYIDVTETIGEILEMIKATEG